MKKIVLLTAWAVSMGMNAQTFRHYTTTDAQPWQESKVALSGKAATSPLLTVKGQEKGHEFKAWGTCFNELDLDAIRLLKEEERQEVMRRLFAPDGDLKFTRGRLTMNANDYSRAWYSCDTVAGDFQLRYFNIEHDKENVIQLIRMAQKYQPEMTFWVSPWSPPAWMKINNDYPVMSSQWNTQAKEKDYLLFDGIGELDEDEVKMAGQQQGKFPRRLAVQDYFIQDPRYLQAYADMFCKFIDLYAAENIPIDMVMYQNEAYSYTPYPGCAWTADGTIRFNRDYLVPTLQKKHPEVKTYVGTFNTNRLDYVEKIMDGLQDKVSGMGLQWEGRDNLTALRQRYPDLHLISSESECGNGSMDWRAGEHTFHLLADYIGKGCDEYFIWNFILCDQGQSPWGWKQNALIQVKSANCSFRYTPEFYAVKHFSNQVPPGSHVLAYTPREASKGLPLIAFQRPDGKLVVVAGNQTNEPQQVTIQLRKKYLNATLPPHSFHTFAESGQTIETHIKAF
ncbi:MAG: glycoside hydrolase family 30 protein [Bacteroidaceae bacterium]|nr:glycoside hydrolase family 30 protein [Bacteroidaceae bacterium]